MIEDVKAVVNTPYEKVIATALVMKLLNCYSKLYLNGGQPGTCGLCLRDYYIRLTQNGMELAQKYEEAKNRTCKPAWNGLRYIPQTARHWDSELLTDSEAVKLLENKHLKETDFITLPTEYGKPIPEEKILEDFQKRHAPKVKKVKK